MAAASADAVLNHLWNRRWSTLYRIRVSVLYHLKRERFCSWLDKLVSMATAAVATSAVAALLQTSWKGWGEALSAATAVLSLAPLVFNPAEMARKHGQHAAEFRRLLADCERAGERWTSEQCDTFAARVLELEASEAAPLGALVADCQNQLRHSGGQEAPLLKLSWLERTFKHWVDFDASQIAARSEPTGRR